MNTIHLVKKPPGPLIKLYVIQYALLLKRLIEDILELLQILDLDEFITCISFWSQSLRGWGLILSFLFYLLTKHKYTDSTQQSLANL